MSRQAFEVTTARTSGLAILLFFFFCQAGFSFSIANIHGLIDKLMIKTEPNVPSEHLLYVGLG